MDTFSSVLRRCVQLDSSSNRRRTPIGMRASRKSTFLWTNKGMWLSPFSDVIGFEQRSPATADGKSMKLQTFTFPVAVANDSACNLAKFEIERWNVSLSVCCRFTPWSQFVIFLLRFVSGFVYVFDKRSAKRVLFCVTYLFFARRLIEGDDEIPSGFKTLACEYLGIPATETAAINWNRLLIKFELPSSADYSFIIYERLGTCLPM